MCASHRTFNSQKRSQHNTGGTHTHTLVSFNFSAVSNFSAIFCFCSSTLLALRTLTREAVSLARSTVCLALFTRSSCMVWMKGEGEENNKVDDVSREWRV